MGLCYGQPRGRAGQRRALLGQLCALLAGGPRWSSARLGSLGGGHYAAGRGRRQLWMRAGACARGGGGRGAAGASSLVVRVSHASRRPAHFLQGIARLKASGGLYTDTPYYSRAARLAETLRRAFLWPHQPWAQQPEQRAAERYRNNSERKAQSDGRHRPALRRHPNRRANAERLTIGPTPELPRTINATAAPGRRRRAERAVRRGLREALLWGALGPHRREADVCARRARQGETKKAYDNVVSAYNGFLNAIREEGGWVAPLIRTLTFQARDCGKGRR